MKIKEILQSKGSKVWTVKSTDTIQSAVKILVDQKIGALLVLDGPEKILGVISERDIIRGLNQNPKAVTEAKVSTLMTAKVIVASPDDDTSYVMGIMTKHKIRHVPVMADGKLAGIVSIGDVVKSQLAETHYEIQHLKEYIYGQGPEDAA